MGRALFSSVEKYGFSAPAIRVEPEPVPYPKWSISNRFDPDAAEFLDDCTDEFVLADIDGPPELVVVSDGLSSSSSEASSDSDSGRDSPVLDTTSRAIRVNAIWDRLAADISAGEALFESTAAPAVAAGPADASHLVTVRAPAEAPRPVPILVHNVPTVSAPSTPPSRPIGVLPITIPVAPSTPGPESPVSPSTPPSVYNAHIHMTEMAHLATPSPPPTVSPRFYAWGRAAQTPASPGSPSVRHTHAAGPLTNLGARQSHARITTRRRVQNV